MPYKTLSLQTYASLSAVEISEGVRDQVYSPVALVDAAFGLAEALQPMINCYSLLNRVAARETAVELETEQKGGRFRGVLHGLPLSIKDTYHVPGYRTGMGSNLYKDHVATDWSPLAKRVLDAGAVMAGKTTMPEFGWTAAAHSPLTGHTRNPWNLALTPGGSSSGSAAAVAGRVVPAALSGDGGGSIRIPAAFCGLFGLKPSFGRIGVWPGAVHDQLVHHGFVTRSALDMALMLDVGKGPDARDPWSLPATETVYRETTRQPVTSVRAAFVAEPWAIVPQSNIARVIDDAMRQLRTVAGWNIADVKMPMPHPRAAFEVLWSASRTYTSAPTLDEREQEMDPDLVRSIRAAAHFTLRDYLFAAQARREFFTRMQGMFEEIDVVIMPTLPGEPFPVDAPPQPSPDAILPWIDWAPYTFPFNLSGHPAATLNCGFTPSGLPVGLQVIGSRGRDDVVLQVSHAIEQVLRQGERIPTLTAGTIGL